MPLLYAKEAIAPGTGTFSDKPEIYGKANLIAYNNGTAAAVLTLSDENGNPSDPVTIPIGWKFRLDADVLWHYTVTGNGALVYVYAAWPGRPDVEAVGFTFDGTGHLKVTTM